jgi:hypothetical protein
MTGSFIIGIYDDENKFISSIRSLQKEEFIIDETFTPYPVNEVLHLLKRKSRLPAAAYFSGMAGAAATLAFLYYASVIDWPIMYGGKPFNSFPSFIVITIVLTILTVTIASLAIFSARSKLFPGSENTIFNRTATDDHFVIVVENDTTDVSAAGRTGFIMEENGAIEIEFKEFENIKI